MKLSFILLIECRFWREKMNFRIIPLGSVARCHANVAKAPQGQDSSSLLPPRYGPVKGEPVSRSVFSMAEGMHGRRPVSGLAFAITNPSMKKLFSGGPGRREALPGWRSYRPPCEVSPYPVGGARCKAGDPFVDRVWSGTYNHALDCPAKERVRCRLHISSRQISSASESTGFGSG